MQKTFSFAVLMLALLRGLILQGQTTTLDSVTSGPGVISKGHKVEIPLPKHIYSFEWGTLFHFRGMPQLVSDFRLNGKHTDFQSGFRFYSLQDFQKPFQGLQSTFDQANSYYFSHTKTSAGGTYYLGITHDKAQTENLDRKYRYNKGGMEITVMRGKIGFSKFKFLGSRLFYVFRGGVFVSMNDISADVNISSPTGNTVILTERKGRAFSGMGLIGGATGGLNWRVYKSFSIAMGLSITAMTGWTRERVTVDGLSGHRLSLRYANFFPTAPVLTFSF